MERNMRDKNFPTKTGYSAQSWSEMEGNLNVENHGDGAGRDPNGANLGGVMGGNGYAENPGSGLGGDLGAKTQGDTTENFNAPAPTKIFAEMEKDDGGHQKESATASINAFLGELAQKKKPNNGVRGRREGE